MDCVLFDLDNTLLLRKPSIPEKVFEILSKETPDICYSAVELLQSLSARQVRLGIVSNNYSNIREVLISLDLLPYFDCILISEEIGISKPDPRILALACEKLNTSIENSLYVGDHPFDILCAHDAGMQIAWFPPNRYYQIPSYVSAPEYTITSLTDLLNIM